MTLSRQKKVIIAILTSLFIVCACSSGLVVSLVGSFQGSVITDLEEVHRFGQSIATYTVPSNYREMVGLSLMGAKAVIITHQTNFTNTMLIVLTSVPESSLQQDILQEQLQLSVQYQNQWQGLDLEFERTESRVINGQEAELTYYRGTNALDQAHQQLTGLFERQQGHIFFLAQGPETAWNQEALDMILDSIQ